MKKKKNRYLILLLILLAVSVGFAALSTQLKINGTANITKNSWNVYWDEESISITQGSKGNTEPEVVSGDDGAAKAKVTWEVTLDLPGDFYEFTIDAANAGTVDAMITGITPTVPANLPSYISYSVTYADGIAPAENHLLAKGTKSGNTIIPTTEKYKVRVEYLDTVTPDDLDEIDDEGDTYQFSYQVTYGQAAGDTINPKGLIASCPGCVFAYYTDWLTYTDSDSSGHQLNRSTLNEYTNDYTTLKKNGVQRKYFLGHILDSNNVIQRGFVCGIKNYGLATEKAFCIEGTVNGYDHVDNILKNNIALLQTSELWNNTCYFEYGSQAFCDSTDLHADSGYIDIGVYENYGSDGCWINYDGGETNEGKMHCYED